jgi:cobalamin biosynthesis Mg chelatase CobN
LIFKETRTLYSTVLSGQTTLTKSIVASATKESGVVGQETKSSVSSAGMSTVSVEQQQHKEIVAESVIGSFMVLVIVVFAVGVLLAWRRKVKSEVKGDDVVE